MVHDIEKFNKISKEVDELKAEIIKLKYDTKFKEDQLKALAQNEAEKSKTVQEIRKQNDLLKRDIQSLTETNSNLNETIANQQIKYLDIIITYENLLKSKDTQIFNDTKFKCGKCDDKFDTEAKLDKHLELHCGFLVKYLPPSRS